jgi:3-hydroxyacyl-CoA dehydrogenase
VRIGILGSGLMGGKLGTLFARTGHDVVFSYARSEEKPGLARGAKGNALSRHAARGGASTRCCSPSTGRGSTTYSLRREICGKAVPTAHCR